MINKRFMYLYPLSVPSVSKASSHCTEGLLNPVIDDEHFIVIHRGYQSTSTVRPRKGMQTTAVQVFLINIHNVQLSSEANRDACLGKNTI